MQVALLPPRLLDADTALQRTILAALQSDWAAANARKLDGRLRAPTFALHEGDRRLGTWDPLTRTLSISSRHVLRDTWAEVLLTLHHEMAHQVVSELFDTPGAPAHGELFVRACLMLGIDGNPRLESRPRPASLRVLDRVQKLMSLGSSSNAHEAQAALKKAHELLLRHNLDLKDLDGERDLCFRYVGRPVGRIPLERKLMASLLRSHFFVQTIWIGTHYAATNKRASVLEVSGRPHNVELADYVHAYLARTLDTLWAEHRREQGRMTRVRARRNDFRIGVLMGFEEQLDSQAEVHRGCGLVWLGDPAVNEYYGRRHPDIHLLRGGRYRLGDTHDAGREQGRQIRIRPGVGEESGGKHRRVVRRLLT